MKKEGKINPNIELLRIISILALVLYHVACMGERNSHLEELFLYIADRGWMGTDMFLVIAGYFFYRSFLHTYEGNIYSFLKSRFFRIVPSYFLFVILYLTIGLFIERKVGNTFILPNAYWLYFLTFTANIPMAMGNWSGVALEGLFGISLLVQLYLIFLLIFSISKDKNNLKKILLIIETVVLISRFIPLLKNTAWFSYFFTLTRMDGFIFGILLAVLYEDKQAKELLIRLKTKILLISFLALLSTAPFTGILSVNHSNTSCLAFPLIGLFFSALLNYILTWRIRIPQFYAGDFVYSVYLVKLPLIYIVLRFLDHLPNITHIPFISVIASLIFCIAWGAGLSFIHKHSCKLIKGINKK